MAAPVPQFRVPPEAYPTLPGVVTDDLVQAIIGSIVRPAAPEPRAVVSQVGPAARLSGAPPTVFPQVEPDPNGPGNVSTPPEATPGPMTRPRARLGGGRFGDYVTDAAGGLGAFDWRAPPGAAFAQGFAGAVGTDRARTREAEEKARRDAAAAADLSWRQDERNYQRTRDERSDARAERSDRRADAAEQRLAQQAESNAYVAATRAAAEWKRANRAAGLSQSDVADIYMKSYAAYGLTGQDAGYLSDEDRAVRTREAEAAAQRVIEAAERQANGGAPSGSGEAADLPGLTGTGTEDDPFDGLASRAQAETLPSGAYFVHFGTLYRKD